MWPMRNVPALTYEFTLGRLIAGLVVNNMHEGLAEYQADYEIECVASSWVKKVFVCRVYGPEARLDDIQEAMDDFLTRLLRVGKRRR